MTPMIGTSNYFFPVFLFWLVFTILLCLLWPFAHYTEFMNKKKFKLQDTTFDMTNFSKISL